MRTKLIKYLLTASCGIFMNSVSQANNFKRFSNAEKTTKFLIIHADDLGGSHSINQASITAFQSGAITSGSVMLPCPWVQETAELLKDCKQCDVGVHFTLNSEWQNYKWQPVTSFDKVRSLVDEHGYLLDSPLKTFQFAETQHIREELEAQINKAFKLGLKPSHVDIHMGTVSLKAEWGRAYVQAAKNHSILPMLVKWSEQLEHYYSSKQVPFTEIRNFLLEMEQQGEFMLDRLIMDVGGTDSLQERKQAYIAAIRALKPGVTQIITHLSAESSEFAAMTKNKSKENRRYWDAIILADPKIKKLLADEGVVLTNWGEIREVVAYKNKTTQSQEL